MNDDSLDADDLALLRETRRAVLATIAPGGSPRLVPVCFAVVERPGAGAAVYLPLDDKPKRSSDVRNLARVRDVLARPRAALLVDRWDEEWTRLAWLRLEGPVRLVEPAADDLDEHRAAVEALRVRYPQYAGHRLEGRPLMRLTVERAVRWAASGGRSR